MRDRRAAGRKRRYSKTARRIAILLLLIAPGAVAGAEKHALLIGIGDYPALQKLKGPRHDVLALERVLVSGWRFEPENVETLVDRAATKRGILDAIERLETRTEPGDFIFLYYSGHGTSAFDAKLRLGREDLLGKRTGALMPYDSASNLSAQPTAREWAEGLIVGERDLRPRLEKLDRDRSVFAVFDTCFAGNTVRSLGTRKSRGVNPPVFRSLRGVRFADDPFVSPVFGEATAGEAEYPYSGLIYLAAAGRKERAEEISGRYTVDGQPHGALTNALLAGLRGGAADTDRDARLTYLELFEHVRDRVALHHDQLPRLLYPEEREDLIGRAVFDSVPGFPKPPSRSAELVSLTYPRQDYELRLELSAEPTGLRIVGQVDRPAVLVLLNIDTRGTVAVLYPMTLWELRPTTEIREDFQIVAPYGREHLKLFAFHRAPERLVEWIDRVVEARDPRLPDLLHLLEAPALERAQTTLEVLTSQKAASEREPRNRVAIDWRKTP